MKTITAIAFFLVFAALNINATAQERNAPTTSSQPSLSDGLLVKSETQPEQKTNEQTGTLNDNGKPAVNIKLGFEQGFTVYQDAFLNWLKATPDYEEYLTPEEKSFVTANDIDGLYKYNYKLVATMRRDIPENENQ